MRNLTKDQIEATINIPTLEIEHDIIVTQCEIDQYESELIPLRNNPVENKLRIYMTEGKILQRISFIGELNQILEYRKLNKN